MKIPSYPKIFHLGSPYIPDLFKGEVEVTEKIDGSMFCFGVDSEGHLVMRSKGQEIFMDSHEKMWDKALEYVQYITPFLMDLVPDTYFYGEYLRQPKHNTLCYERTPKNNIMLYGVRVNKYAFAPTYDELKYWATKLELEPVPLVYGGFVQDWNFFEQFLERQSILGNETLEGVVIKNYAVPSRVGSMEEPSFAKFVRESFKERNKTEWKGNSTPNKLETFLASFRTEARWEKAIQHLRDAGQLIEEPKDIGILLKEIQHDVFTEEQETIKQELYNIYKEQIGRRAIAGFPEWYKTRLAQKAFEGTNA